MTAERRPQILGPMLETHAGYFAFGPDDQFDIGAIYIDHSGRYLKQHFAWKRLGDKDASAREEPVASESQLPEGENKSELLPRE